MNALVLDVGIILFFAVFVVVGFKKGVIKSFISLIGSLFATVFSIYFSSIASDFIYSNMIQPSVKNKLLSVVSSGKIDYSSLFKVFPKFILNFFPAYGITPEKVNHIINSSAADCIPNQVLILIKPAVCGVLKPLCVVVAFVILNLIVKWLSGMLSSGKLKSADSIIGGFFGAFTGYLVIMVFMCCLKVMISMGCEVPEICAHENISATVVFKEIYNVNPIYGFFNKI